MEQKIAISVECERPEKERQINQQMREPMVDTVICEISGRRVVYARIQWRNAQPRRCNARSAVECAIKREEQNAEGGGGEDEGGYAVWGGGCCRGKVEPERQPEEDKGEAHPRPNGEQRTEQHAPPPRRRGRLEDHGERYGEKRRLERVREGARAKDERRPRARVQEQYPMRWQSVAAADPSERRVLHKGDGAIRQPRSNEEENGIRNFQKAHWQRGEAGWQP